MAGKRDQRIISEIGRRVEQRRKQKGLSLTDLGALAEIDPQTVHRIEKGKVSPQALTLIYLAEALGTDPGDLIAGLK